RGVCRDVNQCLIPNGICWAVELDSPLQRPTLAVGPRSGEPCRRQNLAATCRGRFQTCPYPSPGRRPLKQPLTLTATTHNSRLPNNSPKDQANLPNAHLSAIICSAGFSI